MPKSQLDQSERLSVYLLPWQLPVPSASTGKVYLKDGSAETQCVSGTDLPKRSVSQGRICRNAVCLRDGSSETQCVSGTDLSKRSVSQGRICQNAVCLRDGSAKTQCVSGTDLLK